SAIEQQVDAMGEHRRQQEPRHSEDRDQRFAPNGYGHRMGLGVGHARVDAGGAPRVGPGDVAAKTRDKTRPGPDNPSKYENGDDPAREVGPMNPERSLSARARRREAARIPMD